MKPVLNLHPAIPGGPAPGLTFGSFAVGASNREACSAARAAADTSDSQGMLLLLTGGTGTGKTHLLHAVHAELLAQNPSAAIRHLTADDFVSFLIQAIRAETTEQFRRDFESADALLLDDIHFLAGKEHTQEELFRILAHRLEHNRLTVLTLDPSDEEAARMENDLRSRFPDLLTAEIDEPDDEVRIAVTRIKAAELDLTLSEEEVGLIARQATGSLRSIPGILSRISLYRAFPEAFPDAPSVAEIAADAVE